MKLRLGYLLSCLACVYLVGGHWAVLQSVAWMGMIADYSREYGARRALEMTLDGNNPCDLCIKINEKKAEEQKQDLPVEKLAKEVKKVPLLPASTFSTVHSGDYVLLTWPAFIAFGTMRNQAPPRPVPRTSSASLASLA